MVPYAFVWEKGKTMDILETIVVHDVKGQGHSLTLVQGHSNSTFSNFFSRETARAIEAKFHVEPQWDRGTKE